MKLSKTQTSYQPVSRLMFWVDSKKEVQITVDFSSVREFDKWGFYFVGRNKENTKTVSFKIDKKFNENDFLDWLSKTLAEEVKAEPPEEMSINMWDNVAEFGMYEVQEPEWISDFLETEIQSIFSGIEEGMKELPFYIKEVQKLQLK